MLEWGKREENCLEGKTKLANISKRISGHMNILKVNFANYREGVVQCTIRACNRDPNSSLIKGPRTGCGLLIGKAMVPMPALDVHASSWQT